METDTTIGRVVTTPCGPGRVVAETAIPAESRPGEELVVQRVATATGELMRIGYRRGDRMMRGPVSATAPELAALRDAVRGILPDLP
jgi:hypothetical protein